MPFAGYEDFEDCVEDNQNLDNPEAFCAWLEDRVENNTSGVGSMENKKIVKPDHAELKVVDEDGAGAVEGYASVFGNIDQDGEIVERGAFTKTLNERVPAGKVKFVDFHNSLTSSEEILGVVEEAKEDERGLWFKARLSETERAQNVRTKIKENILDSLSIGYDVIEDELDRDNDVRRLKELKLWEISVVSWGANEQAGITNVKELGKQTISTLEKYKQQIKEGRVLSQSNYNRIQDVVETIKDASNDLEALLEAAEPEKSTHGKQESPEDSEEPGKAHSEDIGKMLSPLKEIVAEQKGEKIKRKLENFKKELRNN